VSFSYATCSLNKYMDKHSIRSDTRAFQLLTRFLTIDPIKRLSGKTNPFFSDLFYWLFCVALDAMNDAYFKDDPRPTDE
jgi:cyclin-dependent kinase 8/11